MLNDEQQFIVMRRIAEGFLRGQQGVELQVSPVRQSIAQVDFDALFELTSVFHDVPVIRWWLNSPNYPTRESLASPANDRQAGLLLLRRALHLAAALAINCRPSWRWATLRHS